MAVKDHIIEASRITTKEGAANFYVNHIGYDPFADDPELTLAEVVKTVDEYIFSKALNS